MQTELITLNDAELAAAREWLADCEFAETEFLSHEDRVEFFASMTAKVITAGVERHYDGGVAAFVREAV